MLHSKPILPGEFLPEDPQSRLDPLTCLSARLMVVTLCRRGEAVAARWDEIDRASKKWTVPRERTKSRRTEIKPLSDEAIAILDTAAAVARLLFNDQNCEFVFPLTEDPSNHIDGHRVARAITRLCRRLGIPHGSPHDFRRTGATTLTDEKYGFTRFIISKGAGTSYSRWGCGHRDLRPQRISSAKTGSPGCLGEARQGVELAGGGRGEPNRGLN